MSIHRHITSVKRNADISVILYGSHSIPRMTSFGPKSLFEVGGLSLLNRQILILNDSLGKYELFICSQFELEKFLNRGYKIVENQLVESNDCEDIRLALNLCSYKNVLLIDQACLLLDKVTSKFQQSFVGIGKGSEEISVNFDKKVEAFSFGGSDLKWKGITFIHEKDFPKFKSVLDLRVYTKSFLFELLNNLTTSISFGVEEVNAIIIDNPKQLRQINESFNSINK